MWVGTCDCLSKVHALAQILSNPCFPALICNPICRLSCQNSWSPSTILIPPRLSVAGSSLEFLLEPPCAYLGVLLNLITNPSFQLTPVGMRAPLLTLLSQSRETLGGTTRRVSPPAAAAETGKTTTTPYKFWQTPPRPRLPPSRGDHPAAVTSLLPVVHVSRKSTGHNGLRKRRGGYLRQPPNRARLTRWLTIRPGWWRCWLSRGCASQ